MDVMMFWVMVSQMIKNVGDDCCINYNYCDKKEREKGY